MVRGKKAQTWYLDLFVSIMIFVGVLLLFFKAEINVNDSEEPIIEDMEFEARMVTNILISTGYPSNWTGSNVQEIGITNGDYRINKTKLIEFANMNYWDTKSKLKTKYDYYMFIKNGTKSIKINSSNEGIGKAGVNSSNINEVEDPSHIVKATRLLIYENQAVNLVVYLWSID